MRTKIVLLLCLLLPAIPAVFVMLSFMGVTDNSPFGTSPDVYSGMNPIAAIGWGFGVYFIELTAIGLGFILVESLRTKKC